MTASIDRMSYKDLRELVELIHSFSHFGEVHLKLGELELDLRRAGVAPGGPSVASTSHATPAPPLPSAPTDAPTQGPVAQQRHGHVGGGEVVVEASPTKAAAPHAPNAATDFPAGAVLIKSPMVGSFYRAPEPGARAFVEVGDQVRAEATVCIIEVMKLMNSIPASVAGTVTHILVGDGEAVEYGQLLMVLDPA